MSRLLFAAARGARVQVYIVNGNLPEHRWKTVHNVPIFPCADFRIHPDDEHLQYGPISSALREFAEMGKEPYTVSGLMAMRAFSYECTYPFIAKYEWHHAEMFALILAEALADEGL